MLPLRTPVELRGEQLTTVGDFTVSAGQRVPFVLTYVPSHLPLPEPVDVGDALRSTEKFWQPWASACRSTERHAEIITRSLITLKALTYAPTLYAIEAKRNAFVRDIVPIEFSDDQLRFRASSVTHL